MEDSYTQHCTTNAHGKRGQTLRVVYFPMDERDNFFFYEGMRLEGKILPIYYLLQYFI